MLKMTPEERKEFAMIGVRARLAKRPPFSKEEMAKRRKAERDALRKQVINHYGNVCQCCGEANHRFLTIDHIDGGGAKHRRSINKAPFYRWLRRNAFPEGFQTLCYNCNCSKGIYGICAHAMPH